MRAKGSEICMARIGLMMLAVFLPSCSLAAERFVSPAGSNVNPGTAELPWRDIAFATCGGEYGCPSQEVNQALLQAGDVLNIMAGNYSEVGIRIAKRGRADAPITIRSAPDAWPVIDGGQTTPNGTVMPVFNVDGNDYVVFDGLTIRRGVPANIYISENNPSSHITIQSCDLSDYVADSNSGQIFIDEGSSSITIFNCRLHGMQGSNFRGAGVMIFGPSTVHIVNNEILGSADGVYYKNSVRDNQSTIIENNYIHDTSHWGVELNISDVVVRNNLFLRSGTAIRLFDAGDCALTVTRNNSILHNTIVDGEAGIIVYNGGSCEGALLTTIRDNLVTGFTSGVEVWPDASTDGSQTTFDHNLVYSSGVGSPVDVTGTHYTVAALPQTLLGRDGNLQSAPLFVGGNAPVTVQGYALANGSPGEGAASDLDQGGARRNMGADLSRVGVSAGAGLPPIPDGPRPAVPRGLRIR
jgi:nitrous oxidase accessory protein NosD